MRYSVKLDQIVMEFRLEFHHCYMLVGFKGLGFIENLGLKPRRSTTALLLNMSIVYEIYAKM
ncbi:hypothetical protein FXO09_07700 [Microcystis aeruginosa KLA2]|jgi:hypothetical protein|uniref:Uncharacterized protein n=4 Tax=Microcystis TaxID=1125 RepID=A0A552DGR0_MICAE|nr:MAG: hypothetical protein DWQ56_25010 [Microcystis aeruginosa DA14]TRT98229.1 MAG: hypothetical protein EWV62_08930 [Microcystis aeruginosa Ma_OC_LR_19540900_S633]TRU21420.1 MAG: hypothetical protein EWV80_16050 [Microcystis aeruginosa Ma_QC_B_20070730_S2]TYT71753.1 hypothetical protein FXO09_07700 [Microcystis aeruginosa KLA2]CCI09496.1 hypothetical protein MICAD_600002 [Microcystis aeruginosa PCC 7941]CCI27044.1 hypothetical protein MICAG_3390002 [Microcystis aeruginosa PCC 9808]